MTEIFEYFKSNNESNYYFNIEEYIVQKNWDFHWHEYYEIECVLEGKGEHYINENIYELNPGDIFLITPNDLHKVIQYEISTLKVINIKFNEYMIFPELLDYIYGENLPITASLIETDFNDVLLMCNKMTYIKAHDKILDNIFIKSLLSQLIVLILINMKNNHTSYINKKNSLPPNLKKVITYIKFNFKNNITLDDITKQLYLSKNYCSEYFRKYIGMSFIKYLNKIRLNYAAKLLIMSDMEIIEICYESGFSSVSTFYKNFKQYYKVSPKIYRNNNKLKGD